MVESLTNHLKLKPTTMYLKIFTRSSYMLGSNGVQTCMNGFCKSSLHLPITIPNTKLFGNTHILGLKKYFQPRLMKRNFFSWKRAPWKQNMKKSVKRQYMAGEVTGKDPNLGYDGVSMKDLAKFMMRYVWPKNNPSVKRRVIVALSLLIGAKLLNIQVPFLFKRAVDKLSNVNMDDTATAVYTTVFCLIFAYGMARAGTSLCNELRDAVFAKVAQSSIRNVARSLFSHLHHLDLSFHLNRQTGGLSKAIDRGTRGINFALRAFVFHITPTLFEVTLVSSLLWYKCGGQFAAVTLATLMAYTAWTFSITAWRTKFRIRMNKADNEIGNIAIDSLINYETVKYFNNEAHEVERYDKVLAVFEDANLKTMMSLAFLNFGQQLIFSGGLTCIMLLAAHGIQQGTMTVGDLVLVNGLLFQLSMPLNFLGTIYRDIKQSVIDMQAMFSLMNMRREIENVREAPLVDACTHRTSIVFDDVTFGYGSEKTILEKLSLRVEPGQRVGVVGGSGSGKSTLIRLLYRFYDTTSGSVRIGDRDIRSVDIDSVRRMIGIVPQDTVLFHDTIYHNIAYGQLSASREEVEEAAKMADVHEAILAMPEGYQTMVGERGLKLSGGEKQRIAIARTILKKPSIVLYDEATSSLDSITEEHILEAIRRVTKQRTSIFIAHRLSTVMDCDRIFVLNKGGVAEQGTHEELMQMRGSLYQQMWHSQHKNLQLPAQQP